MIEVEEKESAEQHARSDEYQRQGCPSVHGRRDAFGLVCPSKFMRIMASRSSSGPVPRRQPVLRQFPDLIFAVLAGIDQHLAGMDSVLPPHREFLAQQVHQARHTRRPPATMIRWMFSPLAVARKSQRFF